MHEIGNDTIGTATGLIRVLLNMYKKELQAAYLKEENSLSVALSLKFKPSDDGGVEVDAGINFITSRVKDNISRSVVEGQEELFKNAGSGEGQQNDQDQHG